MRNRSEQGRNTLPILAILFSCLVILLATACSKSGSKTLFHRFPDRSWARFNILSFEIPIEKANTYNIYLDAMFTMEYQYKTLNFNMIMDTPAGEERINEYQLPVKSNTGGFCIECTKDSCRGTILLKKEINFPKPGVLKIELENLTPRLTTPGILGVGIRLLPLGK